MKKLIALAAASFALAGSPLAQADDSDIILGSFFVSNEDTSIKYYLSEDGFHMNQLRFSRDTIVIEGRDPSFQYYKEFYYLCLVDNNGDNTFKIYRSLDLKRWESKSFSVTERNKKYNNIWAPDLFINDDGSAYVYFSKQRDYNSKNDERLFDIWVSKISNIDSFTMEGASFEEAKKVDLPPNAFNNSSNYIDAQVRKIDGTYYMIVKNEAKITNNYNKSPILLKSKDPDKGFEEVSDWPLRYIRGYEGFSMLLRGDKVYIYGDNFAQNYDDHHTSNHGVWIVNKNEIETGPYQFHYVESSEPLRHGSVTLINNDKEKINKLGFVKTTPSKMENREPEIIKLEKDFFGDPKKSKGNDIVIDYFAPAPNVLYVVPNRKNVIINNIVNPYGVTDFKISVTDGATLNISSLSKKQSFTKEKNAEKDKIITFDVDPEGHLINYHDK